MSLFSRRTIAALAIATVATFPVVGSAAHAATGHGKKTANSHSQHTKKFHASFVLIGKVKAVGDSGVTVTVKGGNLKKALRGTDVVVAVNDTTKITVKDAPKTLADITVGDRVAVKGSRTRVESATTYTAKRVHVKHPRVKTESEPVATATPTSTATS